MPRLKRLPTNKFLLATWLGLILVVFYLVSVVTSIHIFCLHRRWDIVEGGSRALNFSSVLSSHNAPPPFRACIDTGTLSIAALFHIITLTRPPGRRQGDGQSEVPLPRGRWRWRSRSRGIHHRIPRASSYSSSRRSRQGGRKGRKRRGYVERRGRGR